MNNQPLLRGGEEEFPLVFFSLPGSGSIRRSGAPSGPLGNCSLPAEGNARRVSWKRRRRSGKLLLGPWQAVEGTRGRTGPPLPLREAFPVGGGEFLARSLRSESGAAPLPSRPGQPLERNPPRPPEARISLLLCTFTRK